jgi:hypothetical protein
MNEKDHPIIDKPWEYKIISFRYECSPASARLQRVLFFPSFPNDICAAINID